MLNSILLKETALLTAKNTMIFQMDPLEQFDVMALSAPIIGSLGLTNLSVLLALNVAVMAS
jgi:hypothetical protein